LFDRIYCEICIQYKSRTGRIPEIIATNVGQFAVDSVLGSSSHVNVGDVTDVSGMCISFILSVAVWWVCVLFISIPLTPYSYGVEVLFYSLDLYTIGRTP
jgi:hypothetical protein